jgi:hypothetical protein
VFADAATTRRAIAGTGHPLAKEELSSAPDDMDQVMTDANLDPAGEYAFVCTSQPSAVPLLTYLLTGLEYNLNHPAVELLGASTAHGEYALFCFTPCTPLFKSASYVTLLQNCRQQPLR